MSATFDKSAGWIGLVEDTPPEKKELPAARMAEVLFYGFGRTVGTFFIENDLTGLENIFGTLSASIDGAMRGAEAARAGKDAKEILTAMAKGEHS
jgi:hypothetical protein